MSSVSQTPARRPWSGWRRAAFQAAIVAAILAVALKDSWPSIFARAAAVRPHGPDLELFAALPLAVQLHILGAVGALALGWVLMAVRKGRTFHRVAGWVWVGLAAVVVGSSIFITDLNNGRFSVLHIFTAVSLISLPVGVAFARRHQVKGHRSTMMGLFFGGFAVNVFIAFIPGRTMWNMFFG